MAFVIAAVGVVFGFVLNNKQLEGLWLLYRDNITDRDSYIREYKKMIRLITIYMTCIGAALLIIRNGSMGLWLVLIVPILVELCVAPKITGRFTKSLKF